MPQLPQLVQGQRVIVDDTVRLRKRSARKNKEKKEGPKERHEQTVSLGGAVTLGHSEQEEITWMNEGNQLALAQELVPRERLSLSSWTC